MERIDWSKVHRVERPYSWFTFEDANLGVIKIGLRKLLSTEEDAADEAAADHTARYVTGGFLNDADIWCKEPTGFPTLAPDDPPIRLTKTSIRSMCRIELMQPPDQRHGFADLVYMSQYGDPDAPAYDSIDRAAGMIMAGAKVKGEGEAGNAGGEASDTQSTDS